MTAPEPGRRPPGSEPDDDDRMGPTRIRDLVVIAAVAGIAMWILIRYNYGDFPPLPWPAGLLFYVLAVIEVIIGFIVRARVANREVGAARGQLHPITAARLVALAKASAILGAIAAGGWTGVLAFLYTNGILDAARADRPAAIVGAVGGVLLAAAAVWLEHCCRAPDDPEPDGADPERPPQLA
ncbi:DUF3180 domain-containing protein [Gordonia shandongensis]|uniref:DUF3180 domain-containing protein n=1 Tax=Gordonia shandongensis TaxID=376351 RepID=UPI00040E2CF1|nr:DUF3180 domain-containing protein [Gordonia shandongensis]